MFKTRNFRSSLRGGSYKSDRPAFRRGNYRSSAEGNSEVKPAYSKPSYGNSSYSSRAGRYSNGGRSGGYQSRGNNSYRGGFGGRTIKYFSDVNVFVKKASEVATSELEISAIQSFDQLDISNPLKENLKTKDFITPTPIQSQSIPSILKGRDLIGLAQTGTGKTGAFLIPIIDKIFKTRDQKALIIVPTRELALQIQDELRSFANGMKIYSALLIGGASIGRQIHEVRRNPHVLIATPGRLKDLVKRDLVHLDEFKMIVLDEVDLMVDIGFIQDIKFFISQLPKIRQSLFFSATISPKIKEVLTAFVKDPVTVSIRKQPGIEHVDQDVVKIISQDKKLDQLHDLLIKDGFDKVLVFGRTKHGVEKLNNELEFRGFKVGAIHGNKSQGHRQRVIRAFKSSEIKILLATDVASRGLDIPDVSHVINYDLPETYEDYIHRIGRTGRAGKIGTALTFIT